MEDNKIFKFDDEKEDKKSFKEENEILEKNLTELCEIFPSFMSYAADWKFAVEENVRGMSAYGFVRKDKYRDRYDVVCFPQFFKMKKQRDEQLKGFLLHEMFHVYSKHFERAAKHSKDVSILIPKYGMQPSLWNVSQDLCINHTIEHFIKDKSIKLPKGGIRFELFPKKIRDDITGRDSEFVFDYLKKEYEKDTEKFQKMMEEIAKEVLKDALENGQAPGQGQPQQGNGQPQPGQGQGQGTPIKINIGFDDHSDLDKMEASGDEGLRQNVEDGKITCGRSPDGFAGVIQKMRVKNDSKVKLDTILKDIRSSVISNSSSVISGVDRSYRHYNRRYASINKKLAVPMIVKGEKAIHYQKELFVALDTSGSVTDNDLEMALKVINKFLKDFHFNLTFIQVDDHIRDVKKVKHAMRDVEIIGRGGTDYQVTFDHINKDISSRALNKKNCLAIYIGDGGIMNAPSLQNHSIQTIWLMTSQYDSSFVNEVPFGKKLFIPDLTSNEGI